MELLFWFRARFRKRFRKGTTIDKIKSVPEGYYCIPLRNKGSNLTAQGQNYGSGHEVSLLFRDPLFKQNSKVKNVSD